MESWLALGHGGFNLSNFARNLIAACEVQGELVVV